MAVMSLGPLDESAQIVTFTCYLRWRVTRPSNHPPPSRQSWRDFRLQYGQFSGLELEELSMNWRFLADIWRPDTYFLGGRRGRSKDGS